MTTMMEKFQNELERLDWDSDYGGYDETNKVFSAFEVATARSEKPVTDAEIVDLWLRRSVGLPEYLMIVEFARAVLAASKGE